MKTRTIKHKVFTYYVEKKEGVRPDGSLGPVTLERQARRGETVELRDADANRGDELGAFYTDAELRAINNPDLPAADQVSVPPTNAVDLVNMSESDVVTWLTGGGPGSKPSVAQVLSAVKSVEDEDEQAEVAQRVLDAEKSRGDSDPRSTLVGPLEEILEEPEPEEEEE